MLEGSYDLQVQSSFGNITTFLLKFGEKIQDFERKEKLAERMARMEAAIDIGDNYIDGEVGSEIGDNEGTPAAKKMNKIDILQQAKFALGKCQNLCEDASHKVVRRGECGDKIQEMKKEFAGIIEFVAKLRH